MSLRRILRVGLLLAAAVASAPRLASAVCTVTACNDALQKIVENPACCGAQLCTLDGTITLNGPVCTFDFDGRDVRLTGTLFIGSGTLDLRARSLTVAGLVNARGAGTASGGNLMVTTSTGGLAITGAVDLSGFGRGGGSLSADVGGEVSVVTNNGIHADARGFFGDGGTILLGSRSGTMTIAGPVTANAAGDGFGGTITLEAGGGALLLNDNARVAADGESGTISLGSAGAMTIESSARVSASGPNESAASGGTIDVTANAATLTGTLQATGGSDLSGDIGGDGGAITMDVQRGALLISRGSTAALDVSGAAGGAGGEVSLATASSASGVLTLDGIILATGQGGSLNRPGGGGIVEVTSRALLVVAKKIDVSGTGEASGEIDIQGDRDVNVTAPISGRDPSGGGTLNIDAGHDLTIGADLNMHAIAAGAGDGFGGEITLTAGNDLAIQPSVSVNASGSTSMPGGIISASAGRHLSVAQRAALDANGGATTGGPGGEIVLEAGLSGTRDRQFGNLTIDGSVSARGKNSTFAASIVLSGCDVTIGSQGTIDSTTSGTTTSAPGNNMVIGRTRIAVNGRLRAQTSNQATFPTGTPPGGSGQVAPAFVLNPRPPCTPTLSENCLVPCPVCGDQIKDFFEDCDPPSCNTSCDIHCRTLACDDSNGCTNDSCHAVFGCVHEPAADGTTCSDNNPCTASDACAGELCFSRTPTDCDDHNACTLDSCNPPGGCRHLPINCNDNDVCTQTDICAPATGCINKDLLPCAAGKVCDAAQGCVEKPCTTAAQCDDENPCTEDTCNASGKCQSSGAPRNGSSCADSNVCNGNETCQNGTCLPGVPLECADNDACTAPDTCDPIEGCLNDPVAGCCNVPADCPGATLCGTCVDHACGTIDNCCVSDGDCDDGNPCTTDGPCGGNNRCPAGVPVTDHRACGDACQPATCNDEGECMAGTPVDCPDDGDPCTDNFCDPQSGCRNVAIEGCCTTAGPCGSACTFCDLEAFRCTTTPGCVACTLDTDCDPDGRCVDAQQIGSFNACGPEGKCIQAARFACDDENAGTNDVCMVDGGGAPFCRHVCLNAAACDDGNACNGVETCNAGNCGAGPALDCNDGDACTIDGCDPARGCVPIDEEDFGAVRCELDNIAAALANAAPEDVSAQVRSKIERLLAKARAKLTTAEGAGPGKKAQKALGAVKAQAKMIRQAAKAAVKKRKMSGALGTIILGASDGASQAAQTLRSRLRT